MDTGGVRFKGLCIGSPVSSLGCLSLALFTDIICGPTCNSFTGFKHLELHLGLWTFQGIG